MNFFFSNLNLSCQLNSFVLKYKIHKINAYLCNDTKLNNFNLVFCNKFINKIFLKGLKKKLIKILNDVFYNLYLFIKSSNNTNLTTSNALNKEMQNKFFFYNEIKALYLNNAYIKNPLFLLSWIFSIYYFVLQIKIKKKKKNIKYSIDFLNFEKRSFFFMFFFKTLNKDNLNLKKFIVYFIFDCVLNYKKSYLYRKKIKLYKYYINS